jgi:hypothetical protein
VIILSNSITHQNLCHLLPILNFAQEISQLNKTDISLVGRATIKAFLALCHQV